MRSTQCLCLVFLAAVAQMTSAQSPLTLSFSSEPATRLIVTPRLTGSLPGCQPDRAELVLGGRFTGVLKVSGGPEICASAVGFSDLTLAPMSFPSMGIYTIRIEDQAGLIETKEVAVQGLIVNGEVGTYAKFSVDGAWYAPEISGSGLMMTHRRSSDRERTFGAWFNFDGDGRARWHTLQESRWSTPTRLTGSVYKSHGAFQDCGFAAGDSDCQESLSARPASSTEKLGSYELEMLDDSNAILKFVMDSGVRHETRLRKLL